jgi:hypothetical protein
MRNGSRIIYFPASGRIAILKRTPLRHKPLPPLLQSFENIEI